METMIRRAQKKTKFTATTSESQGQQYMCVCVFNSASLSADFCRPLLSCVLIRYFYMPEVCSNEWEFIYMSAQEEDLIFRMYRLVGERFVRHLCKTTPKTTLIS